VGSFRRRWVLPISRAPASLMAQSGPNRLICSRSHLKLTFGLLHSDSAGNPRSGGAVTHRYARCGAPATDGAWRAEPERAGDGQTDGD
jgi:hypothetical protein